MMRKGSKYEADPLRQNAGSIYLLAVSEPNVASIAQNRTGLAMIKPTNAIRRKRLDGLSAPIGGQRRGLGCGVGT